MSEQEHAPADESEPIVTMNLITPNGFPVQLTFGATTTGKTVQPLLETAEKFAKWLEGRKWQPDGAAGQRSSDQAPPPQQQAAAQHATLNPNQPTFAGFNCAWSTDKHGYPAYILDPDTGEQATKKIGQNGDVWYSVNDGTKDNPNFRHLLDIGAGDTLSEEAEFKPPSANRQETQ